MAEFKMVMEGWVNICKHNTCGGCPVKNETGGTCWNPDKLNSEKIKGVENAVLEECPVWIPESSPFENRYQCSKCGCKAYRASKFCPDCGLLMRSY